MNIKAYGNYAARCAMETLVLERGMLHQLVGWFNRNYELTGDVAHRDIAMALLRLADTGYHAEYTVGFYSWEIQDVRHAIDVLTR